MNKIRYLVFAYLIIISQQLCGFYAGVGFGWNTIDETFNSDLFTNENKSGQDRYETSRNRLAPLFEVGYECHLCNSRKCGLSAQWKYLNYTTPNVSTSRGQILLNATFSSRNIFGGETDREFDSKSRLYNELLFLGYVSQSISYGDIYLGIGPALLTSSNSIYVSSVHIPNGVGDHLISTSVKKHKNLWGGAIQAGYEYMLNSCSAINFNYSYLQTGKYQFKNSINTAILNGASTPGPTTLFLKRTIKFTTQELMVSLIMRF